MGCTQAVPPRIHAYYDTRGRLIQFEYPARHNAKEEFTFVSTHDSARFQVEEQCFLVSAEWHTKWIDFATRQSKKVPPEINNHVLLWREEDNNNNNNNNNENSPNNNNNNNGTGSENNSPMPSKSLPAVQSPFSTTSAPLSLFEAESVFSAGGSRIPRRSGPRLRADLRPRRDYRPVNRLVWEYFFRLYGGGPVISFKVPPGLDPDHYLDGSWIRRLRIDEIAHVVFPSASPERPRIQHVDNPLSVKRSSLLSTAPTSLSATATSAATDAVLRETATESGTLQSEIDSAEKDALLATTASAMAADLSRAKMEEARRKQLEANMHFSAGDNNAAKRRLSVLEARAARKSAAQRHVSALFLRGSFKRLLREAVAAGDEAEAQRVAACIVQSVWRARLSRKRAEQLQKEGYVRKIQRVYRARLARRKRASLLRERDRLREEACALLLQTRWRARKARKRVETLKTEREVRRLIAEAAALRLQSQWRIVLARRALASKKLSREELQRFSAAAKRVQTLVRTQQAMQWLRALRQAKRNVFFVTVHSAQGLVQRATNPVVIVHVEKGNSESSYYADPPTTRSSNASLSLFKTKSAAASDSPQWDEQCLAMNVSGADKIVLTVVDKTAKDSDKDIFLGQAVIDLKAHPKAFSSYSNLRLSDLPLSTLAVPLRDINGELVSFSEADRAGKGTVNVSLRLARPGTTHAGWLNKRAAHMFGENQFKARLLFLCEGDLSYCDNEHFLDRPRYTMKRGDITILECAVDKNTNDPLLHIKSKSGEEWFYKFIDDDENDDMVTWLRKLQCANPAIKLNNEGSDSLVERLESSSLQSQRKIGRRSIIEGIKETTRAVSSRVSMFR